LPVDTRNLVKALAGEVEADELTQVLRVEAEGGNGGDCKTVVSK
jgi:hypothetical protein